MSIREEAENERQKLKNMSWKDRAWYVWEYYKFHLLAVILVIGVLSTIGTMIYRQTFTTRLSVAIINDRSAGASSSALLESELREYMGCGKKDLIEINEGLMVERMNSDLANILGNLVNRTISMSNKYFDGVVSDKGVCGEVDEDLKKVVLEEVKKADAKMEQLRVADAMTEIFNIFRRCNKYIDETTPWTLAKDESQKDGLATVLYNLTEAIAIGASLLYSFMPETSEKILAQIHTGKRELSRMDTFGLYPSGQKVTDKPEILFARMDIKEVLEKVEAMHGAEAAADQNQAGGEEGASGSAEDSGIDLEAKAEITYDDFAKLQFQVGEIIKCEAVPKSKKLLCSQVKIGSQVRQILSGIKAYYSPEEMVGKKVMVVTNLKPAKLAGMVSEGMILCAEDAEGNLALMTPEKSMPAGAEIC